jgi:2-polyprenyl-3-methyl-5-hydroxy-6-metoxy-1,4-benzoquinol methylase
VTSSRRTSDFFDSYAHDFDAIYGTRNSFLNRLINRYLRKSMMLRYQKTLEGCNPVEGRTVIDIGCGPGHYSVALAERGAGHVVGIDFAERMVGLAERRARLAGVSDRCEFVRGDFMTYAPGRKFDYSILMGFMDYVAEPRKVIERAVGLTSSRAFFSFPADGGLLSWQRRLRYRRRCELYLYLPGEIERLFQGFNGLHIGIEKIARDYFVTASVEPDRR